MPRLIPWRRSRRVCCERCRNAWKTILRSSCPASRFGKSRRCSSGPLDAKRDPCQTANRRLARDRERVDAYYRGLLSQIQKRIERKSSDPDTLARERSLAEATELDRLAKLEDLRRKYSLRVRLSFADVIALHMPVREISVRLIRKK